MTTIARWMTVGALLGFSVAVGVSCGAAKCTPTNCAFGCCDSAGTCQGGTSAAQCGSSGADCTACGLGQGCQLNRCTSNSGTGGGSGGGSGTGGGSVGGGTGGGAVTGGGTGGGAVTGGGTGGGAVTGGGTGGGGSIGQQERTDGQLGSSCGSCTTGLTCMPQAANGYCTRTCTDSAQCPGGYCYTITGVGAFCLRACASDLECRPGYSCQGMAGMQGCYPAPPVTSNANLNGCYWANGDITYRYQFDGVGSFQDISYNAVSGTITTDGTYSLSGTTLTLQYSAGSGGRTETPTFVAGTPPNVSIGGVRYQRSGAICQ